jgi:ATP-dependent DNA helicase RecG
MNLLAALISRGESETCEFKGPRAPLPNLVRVTCGLLNQQGGVLVWGLDGAGVPTGLPNAQQRAAELNSLLMSLIRPRPLLSVSVETIRDKQLVVVEVPQGADKPYSVEREIWVRVGGSTLRATADQSAHLVEQSASQLLRWECEPMPGFAVGDCDATELALAQREIAESGRLGGDVPRAPEDFLRTLSLFRQGQLTNAAVVLFARQPLAWSPHLAVRILLYGDEHTSTVVDEVLHVGPAIRTLKEVVATIQQRTGVSSRLDRTQLERMDRPAYPLYALREGLVNAMAHRDYSVLGGDVRVEIYPEQLVIRNPGQLPAGWTPSMLRTTHESRPVNPDIARMFLLRQLMEQMGMGTQRLIAECQAAQARPPIWRVDRNTVSLTLFRSPGVTQAVLSERQKRFLRSRRGDFRVVDYVHETEVSDRQARRELAEMVAAGVVERVGQGRATVYRQRRGG